MSKMIVNHKVADFGKWKVQFDAMHDLRKKYGCTGEHIFKGHNDPNELVVITHWGNAGQAKSYGASQDLKDGMQKAGVTSVPNIYFVD